MKILSFALVVLKQGQLCFWILQFPRKGRDDAWDVFVIRTGKCPGTTGQSPGRLLSLL